MAEEPLPEVTEVVPGHYEVRFDDRRVRVLVPAGIGIPGYSDEDLVAVLIAELLARGEHITDVVDVSALLAKDPGLLQAIAVRAELED